jgi:hypothetical protein
MCRPFLSKRKLERGPYIEAPHDTLRRPPRQGNFRGEREELQGESALHSWADRQDAITSDGEGVAGRSVLNPEVGQAEWLPRNKSCRGYDRCNGQGLYAAFLNSDATG